MKDPLIESLRNLHMSLRSQGRAYVCVTANAAASEIERLRVALAEARELLRGLRNWHHAKTQMTEYPSQTKMLYEHMEMWKNLNDFLAATAPAPAQGPDDE
jgi:hypothetical protein